MKYLRLIVILLALGLFTGSAYALNAPAMQGGNPDNWYIEVQFNAATTGDIAVHGAGLCWDTDGATGETKGYTVHLVDADDAEDFAGFVPAYNDYAHNRTYAGPIDDGDVFLMQIRGYHAAVATTNGVTEGQSIEPDVVSGGVQDGDGAGFAFTSDELDANSHAGEVGTSGYCTDIWVDFDKGTN